MGNVRTLCYVDFNKAYPVVQEVKDLTAVYAPVISPNGKYVAFCTRNDIGSIGLSTVYVRKLDALSAPPVRLASDSAFVPLFNVCDARKPLLRIDRFLRPQRPQPGDRKGDCFPTEDLAGQFPRLFPFL
jgi:hypothetical protein